MPRSPWLASLGCTKKAGVPVEAKVAAILRPAWPDLPMPVTISRPRAAWISSTAAVNDCPRPSWMADASAVMPPASASSVRTAEAIDSAPRSLLVVMLGSCFDLAMACARALPRTDAVPVRIVRIATRDDSERRVNHICFISINQSPKARPPAFSGRPFQGLSQLCNALILKRFRHGRDGGRSAGAGGRKGVRCGAAPFPNARGLAALRRRADGGACVRRRAGACPEPERSRSIPDAAEPRWRPADPAPLPAARQQRARARALAPRHGSEFRLSAGARRRRKRLRLHRQ